MAKTSEVIHAAIERILEKRDQCRARGVGTTHHDHDDYQYTWYPPPIRAAEIENIESYFAVCLPDEYKYYLSEVANGGAGPTYYPLHSLLHALTRGGDLSRPFPLEGTWLNHAVGASPEHVEFCRQQMIRGGFIDEGSPVEAFVYSLPSGADSSDGTIVVGESGCGLDEHLVIDGQHCGEIWHDSDGGAACRAPGFIHFIEEWLDVELSGAGRRKQAVDSVALSETDRVRRVHHLLSDLETVFEQLLGQRIQHYSFEEITRERDAFLESGIFDWNRRFVMAEAERALSFSDDGAIRVGLAGFHLAHGQIAMAKEEIERSKGSVFYDAVLHGRILWGIGEQKEARSIFRAFVASSGGRRVGADIPRFNDGELWYYGELDEIERLHAGSLPGAASMDTGAPRLAVAHRYLGEHETAMAICDEDASAHCSWAAVERGANLVMRGRTAEALGELYAAVVDGLVGLEVLAADPVWRDVQVHPAYSELVSAYTGTSESTLTK